MFSVRRLAWVLLLVLVAAWAFVCLRWQALLRVGAQVTIASVANELALGGELHFGNCPAGGRERGGAGGGGVRCFS